jgi:hypothetical protein
MTSYQPYGLSSRMILNDELGRMWKELVVANFNIPNI